MSNSTPASNETRLGLLTHEELNAKEAVALKKTWDFLIENKNLALDSSLVNKAHKFGFDFLYEWAGKYRKTTPLVGQLEPHAPHLLFELMKVLFDDLDYKLQNIDTDNLEDLVRLITWFEHRFIVIHPYTNTNGRMGRLLTNVILDRLGYPILSYVSRSQNRKHYIDAMREADSNDFSELENFIAQELDESINKLS